MLIRHSTPVLIVIIFVLLTVLIEAVLQILAKNFANLLERFCFGSKIQIYLMHPSFISLLPNFEDVAAVVLDNRIWIETLQICF